PADDGLVDLRVASQSEVQPQHALRSIAVAGGDGLHLLHGPATLAPRQFHFGADGVAVAPAGFAAGAGAAFQLELHPVAARSHRVLVHKKRTILVGDHDIGDAAIEEVRQGDGTAIELVRGADGPGNIHEVAAGVEPDALGLIAGEALSADGRPVLGVLDEAFEAAGNLAVVVPVAAAFIGGDVAVGEVEIEAAVVVQIGEPGAPAPAAARDVQAIRL